MDADEILPEAFDRACFEHRPPLPLHDADLAQSHGDNPRAVADAEAIVEIARKHQALIVEDDAYGFLVQPRAIPYCELAPSSRCT